MRNLVAGVLSVIVGSSIISAGVFLGLRQRPMVQVLSAPPTGLETAVEPSAAPATVAIDERLASEVHGLLSAHRSELAKACATEAAGSVNLEMRLIFNGKGELISWGVNDPPEQALLPVAQCLRQHRPTLSVAPTGRPSTVQLFWSLR